MDPLSIAASITGLLSLAAATAAKLDALYQDFKSRPAVLSAISQEISALCLVLGQLESQLRSPNSSGREENEKTLSAVLDLCMRTFQQIGFQVNELQTKLRKGSLSKAYNFMLYPSKMKEISALRDDLEKYKVTLLIALQIHKPTQDSISLEALRQEVEQMRSKILEVREPGISVDFERMDIIKNYIVASSTTLFGKDATESPSGAVIAGDHRKGQEGQIGVTALPSGNDVPTFGSFNGWLSTFAPNPEIPDSKEDELLSAFRNRKNTNSANNRTPPVAIDTIEVASQEEMIPTSDTLSLISQHLPIRHDIPGGKVHLIFVNLRKSGSDQTFTEDLVTSPDVPLYKLIHELHLKGYTKTCGFQTVDRQSTHSPMVPHDASLPVVVSAGSSNYNIPSGLQINMDERLIDFYNRFVLDDPATPAGDLISIKRCKDNLHIHDGRSNNLHLRFQRTLRVPEDGKSYPLPAYFGSYPLLDVETFSHRLPLHMRKKGGLFIPMFQREALSLDFGYAYQKSEEYFAIRIYAGSINAISGKEPQNQAGGGEQDYIVAPKQRRLDGFLAGKGVVKQFVAMPLGFGYSVEKQVTGTEFIGGLQLEIIPRLTDKVKFIRPQRNAIKLPWLPQRLESSEDLFRTPRELGMAPGQLLLMQDEMRPLKSKRMKFDLGFLNDSVGNGGQEFLPVYEEMCRPTFVHEMFLGIGRQHSYPMNESLVLHPVEPLSLRVDWEAIMRSPKGTTVEEYSPFVHISDFKKRITSIKMESEPRPWRTGYILFNGTAHSGYPEEYSPLADYVSEGGIVSWKNAVIPRHDQASELAGAAPGRLPDRDPSWEMALGAGGNLGQSIEKTKDDRLWDWGASKLFNIQILNSVAFKAFTGLSPVTPISFREYVTAKIPFYSFLSVSEDSIMGDHAPTFKSIGQLDHLAVVQVGIRVNPLGKPVGCANCEDNICDTILQPCKHTFCADCIKLTMTTDSSITCVFCSGLVADTIAFSAPMEMPSSPPEERPDPKLIEPVIPYREEDKTCKISSPLITQQGDAKSSSNIVENLIVVLLQVLKDGESPKDIPGQKISDLVADSITGWGYTDAFDMAVRNLMQTSIDIRIPIFKAGLLKAIKSALHHVQQLLLLVPNIDDLDGQDTEFVSAAINAAVNHKSFAILFKWLANGRRPIEDFGLSVRKLLTLVRFDNHDAVDTLLKYVADHKQTLSECSISILTVGKDETYKVTKLIEHGCDPNLQNAEGKTLLHLKAHSADSIETFLALGVRIDIVDNDGNTCIHLAVPKAYPCIAKLLGHKTCTPTTVNIRNRQGLTAYHLSLKAIHHASVRQWFLDAGADPNMEMPKGQFRDEVVAMLRKKDWEAEGYVLEDGLVRELQGTDGE